LHLKKHYTTRYHGTHGKYTHVVKYVAQTLRHEANVGCFTPDKKIQPHIKQLPLLCLLLTLRKSV